MHNAAATFADRFSQQIGGADCYPYWKGRVALYAILQAMDLRAGDEVLLPGYTCVMNANPIVYCGARPVFVDIDPGTFNVDAGRLAAGITPRTRAIIAQHTYGIPCDMDAILELAARCRLPVIEDCCLALGSRYKGRLCGTMGAAAYWSFQWNKTITTGIGGMAAVHDPALRGRMAALHASARPPAAKAACLLALQRAVHRLTVYPQTAALAATLYRRLSSRGILIGSSCQREFAPVMDAGFFGRMGTAQARAGLRGLAALDANCRHRRRIAAFYEDTLDPACRVRARLPPGADPVYVRYPVRVRDKYAVLAQAAARRIELGSWFESPLHPRETALEPYGYALGMCPAAERAAAEVVNLPTHPRVSLRQAGAAARFVAPHLQPPGP